MEVLEAVLEASPDAALVVDEDGMIRLANPNVSDVLGYAPDDLVGQPVETLLREEDQERHVGYRRAYMNDPKPRPMGRDLDLYALHEDGTEVPVEISLGTIERDGALYVVATIGDLTWMRERERELERQNERLDEFASIVSHDLRNPVTVAKGRLQSLKAEVESEQIEHIELALTRMSAMIDDLLTLAREGDMVSHHEPVAIGEVVEHAWDLVETAETSLVIEIDRTIRADRNRLQQLLENVIANAVEHAGTDVTVTVGELDDGFYVEDDGTGISVERRNNVFEAGYSSSSTGTGFGLNIVKEIAAAHDWEVQVSDGTDGGARFEITGVEFVDD